MAVSKKMNDLLSALSHDMNDEEAVLSVIQSLIASEITIRRIDKHMTQKDFAVMLGVSQSTLSKWESGETNFTLSTLVSIANKLDIEMQSPFVPTPPKVYQGENNNIVSFPASPWQSSSFSESQNYTQFSTSGSNEDLLEM